MTPELLAALKVLVEDESVGDWIYEVRERVLNDKEWLAANPARSTWDHPRVKAFSDAVTLIESAIKEAEASK